MGEKQLEQVRRTGAQSAVAELQPQIDAVADLAAAEYMVTAAQAELKRCIEGHQQAWAAAQHVGWSTKQLRAQGRTPPIAASKKRGGAAGPTARPTRPDPDDQEPGASDVAAARSATPARSVA